MPTTHTHKKRYPRNSQRELRGSALSLLSVLMMMTCFAVTGWFVVSVLFGGLVGATGLYVLVGRGLHLREKVKSSRRYVR